MAYNLSYPCQPDYGAVDRHDGHSFPGTRRRNLNWVHPALAGVYYMIIFLIAFGFSIGAQILIGRRNGEGNYKQIGSIFYQGVVFLLSLAVVMFVLSHVFPYILKDTSNRMKYFMLPFRISTGVSTDFSSLSSELCSAHSS